MFYVRRGDRERGPLSSSQLRQLAGTGKLKPTDEVRKADGERWLPAAKVRGLFEDPPQPSDNHDAPGDDDGSQKPSILTTTMAAASSGGQQLVRGVRALAEHRREPTAVAETTPEEPAAPSPDETQPLRTVCGFCGEAIMATAKKCRHCGEILDPVWRAAQEAKAQTVINVGHGGPRWSRGVAMVLSFVIPGLGQIYKGQLVNGVVWLLLTIVGYAALVVPGVVLHLLCIVGAGMGDPYR